MKCYDACPLNEYKIETNERKFPESYKIDITLQDTSINTFNFYWKESMRCDRKI